MSANNQSQEIKYISKMNDQFYEVVKKETTKQIHISQGD